MRGEGGEGGGEVCVVFVLFLLSLLVSVEVEVEVEVEKGMLGRGVRRSAVMVMGRAKWVGSEVKAAKAVCRSADAGDGRGC